MTLQLVMKALWKCPLQNKDSLPKLKDLSMRFSKHFNSSKFHFKLKFHIIVTFVNFSYQYVPQQEVIYKSYFNKIAPQSVQPALKELINNVSLILVNTHPLLQEPRVSVPANVIEIGGLHLKQLTNDVEPVRIIIFN